MTQSGHGSEPPAPHGAVPPPSGEPWWGDRSAGEPAGEPVRAAPQGDAEATQRIPPVSWDRPRDDGEATQYIPPVTGQPQPPGRPQPPGQAPGQPPGAQYPDDVPQPTARHAAPAHMQFDDLFRDSAAATGARDSTQQLPRVAPQGPPQGPPPDAYYYDEERRGSVPRWAAVTIGIAACAAVGVTAGFLFSSGEDGTTASGATPSAGQESPAGGEDGGGDKGGKEDGVRKTAGNTAKSQAEKLSALLADSNDSRSAVISSVEKIKQCKDLGGAAADLRAAARQRTGLVKSLRDLDVGKLAGHAELTSSLTAAWKSSAAADRHYAGWADANARRGCHGRAQPTNQLRAGNRASGDATRAKEQAAKTWNVIARKHGLPSRQAAQL